MPYIGVVGKKIYGGQCLFTSFKLHVFIVHTRPACCNYFLNLRRDEIWPNSKFLKFVPSLFNTTQTLISLHELLIIMRKIPIRLFLDLMCCAYNIFFPKHIQVLVAIWKRLNGHKKQSFSTSSLLVNECCLDTTG